MSFSTHFRRPPTRHARLAPFGWATDSRERHSDRGPGDYLAEDNSDTDDDDLLYDDSRPPNGELMSDFLGGSQEP
jgi:hypothetical protein